MPISHNPKLLALVSRARNILLQPDAEWEKIEAEPATVTGLFKDYVAILAALPAVFGFFMKIIFGYDLLGFSVRPGFMNGLAGAVASYVMSLIGVAVLGFAINFLAPYFHGQKNIVQAFKVAAYSATAAWLAVTLAFLPMIGGIISLAGFYSFYLLHGGLQKLMKSPPDQMLVYTLVVACATAASWIMISLLIMPSAPVPTMPVKW